MLVFLLMLLLTACGDDGRALAQPPSPLAEEQPASAARERQSVPIQVTGPNGMYITSPAFEPGQTIPDVHSCEGEGPSPALSWGNIPADAVELAVTVTDLDSPVETLFTYWVVGGLDPSSTGIDEGAPPQQSVGAINDYGTNGWHPLCGPVRDERRYLFTLYALGQPSGLTADDDVATAGARIEAVTLQKASILGTHILLR